MSFFTELKRRNVLRTAAAYLAFAWLSIEVSDTLLPLFGFDSSAVRILVIVFAVGLVPVLVASWMFEFTLQGIKADRDVDHESAAVLQRSKRLDRWVVVLLAVAVAYFLFDKLVLAPGREQAHVEAARAAAATEAVEQERVAAFDRSVAVLPFVNSGGDPADDYLSAGVADELRDHISAREELRVAARRSSESFRDSAASAIEIGQQLGVSRILEGRLARKGERVVVSVELIDAVSGFRLWSQSYDRKLQDLLLAQQDLARDVTLQLLPGAHPAEVPAPSLQQVAAHDLLLLARQFEQQLLEEQRVDEDMLAKVIDLYGQASEIDPLSAEAQARLGRMLLFAGEVTAAEPHILKALELDPGRGDSFATLGLYYWVTRQDGIGQAYRRAIELNPSDADALAYYASWNWMQGESEAAVEYYRAALRIDPLSLLRYADLGYKLALEGGREEAQQVLDEVLQRFPGAPGYLAAARMADAMGDLDEAVAFAAKALELRPEDADAAGQLGELLARIGAPQAELFAEEAGMGGLFWQRRYADMIELGEELYFDQPADTDLMFLLGFAYHALGQHEQAIDWLERAGLPQNVLSESRRANDLHGIQAYVGSLWELERLDEARRMAEWNVEWNLRMMLSEGFHAWLGNLSVACMQMALGDRELALELLESLPGLGGQAWLPWLQDQACFAALQEEPRYRAVVSALQQRLDAMRERLPQTLARRGASLPAPPQK